MSDTDAATETDEAPALPGDGLREQIVDALRADLADQLIDTHLVPQQDLWVRVGSEAWAFAAQSLRAQGFDYFCFLSAMDWMPSPYGKGEDDPDAEPAEPDTEIRQGYAGGESRFQLIARLTDVTRHVGVTVKADVPATMVMPTWILSYAGANWHERETHEMFGIGFEGHPDLRNLYLPGEFEGFPLRKDFPLLSRMVKPWPGIVDVEPMPDFDEPDEPDAPDAPEADATEAGDAVAEATEPNADGYTTNLADALDAAESTPAASPPDGEPATGGATDTIVTDDGEPEVAADPDAADDGPGTTTMSADADAPTPGEGTDPTDDVEQPVDGEESSS